VAPPLTLRQGKKKRRREEGRKKVTVFSNDQRDGGGQKKEKSQRIKPYRIAVYRRRKKKKSLLAGGEVAHGRLVKGERGVVRNRKWGKRIERGNSPQKESVVTNQSTNVEGKKDGDVPTVWEIFHGPRKNLVWMFRRGKTRSWELFLGSRVLNTETTFVKSNVSLRLKGSKPKRGARGGGP